MTTTPFDDLIDLQEAIDRLAKAQPVFATFKDKGQDEVTAIIFDDEVHTTKSVRLLADVIFFSSELIDQEGDRFDFDEQLETTVP
jgi:hypothetical protein